MKLKLERLCLWEQRVRHFCRFLHEMIYSAHLFFELDFNLL